MNDHVHPVFKPLLDALARPPLRPVEYRKVRVRSDATTTLWGYEARTFPTETVELIQRAVHDGGITDEAKIAEVLHILARSTLGGEDVPSGRTA